MKIIGITIILLSQMVSNCSAQISQNIQIEKVILDYLNTKDFLFKGNGDLAQLSAKSLFNSIAELKPNELNSKQRKAWLKYVDILSYDTEHIKNTNLLDRQREHFSLLSSKLYEMLKSFNQPTKLYYEFCPMANDNKGAYWLSTSMQIENPYFGGKMPACGSIKDSLVVQQKDSL